MVAKAREISRRLEPVPMRFFLPDARSSLSGCASSEEWCTVVSITGKLGRRSTGGGVSAQNDTVKEELARSLRVPRRKH
jgi:hypothetical protein